MTTPHQTLVCGQECTFEPELVAAYKAAKGRALEAAMQSSYPSRSMLNSSQASLRDTFRDSHQQPDGAEVCCSLWGSLPFRTWPVVSWMHSARSLHDVCMCQSVQLVMLVLALALTLDLALGSVGRCITCAACVYVPKMYACWHRS